MAVPYFEILFVVSFLVKAGFAAPRIRDMMFSMLHLKVPRHSRRFADFGQVNAFHEEILKKKHVMQLTALKVKMKIADGVCKRDFGYIRYY